MTVTRKVLLSSVGCLAAAFVLTVCTFATADWPQFQGVNRDGRSLESGIARSWPEEGPNVLWTVPLGPGFASPAIVGSEVYILDRPDNDQDVFRSLNLETGKELWTYSYDSPGKVESNGSRGTPTVDADYVYSIGMLGELTCLDRDTHELVWQKNLLKDFDGRKSGWGIGQNPVLYKNLLIVAPQGPEAYVVALDRETGDEVWRSEGLGGPGYCSPAVVTLGGVEQVVMIAPPFESEDDDEDEDEEWEDEEEDEEDEDDEDREQPPGKVAGLSLEDGSTLWTYDGYACGIPIPYPTQLPDDRLFVTGAYGAGSVMLQITRSNDTFVVKELFRLAEKECGSQIHQPILHENHLYMNNISNEGDLGLTCVTLDGKVLWRTDDTPGLPTFELGNLLFVDGMLIELDGKHGTLHLIEPSPEGYKELSRVKLFSGKQIWAPMALSQGKLLVRNQKEMKCVDLRNP